MESDLTGTGGHSISGAPGHREVQRVEAKGWFQFSQLELDSLLGCLCQEKPGDAINQKV